MAKKHTVTILEGEKEIPANFWIEPYGFVTRTGLQPQREYRWDQLLEFSIEGPEQLQKRVTVTRLLAIGIFAFAKKKASGESFLFARLESKEEIILPKTFDKYFTKLDPYKLEELIINGCKSNNLICPSVILIVPFQIT